MKAYKWFFLAVIAIGFAACSDDSEDEYVGNWVAKGEFDGSERGYAAYFTIGNKGYVVGGWSGLNARLNDVWEYDLQRATWRQLNDMPAEFMPRQQAVGFSLTVHGKSYGYVGTGWHGFDEIFTKDFWRFDPDGDGGYGTWEQVASLPERASARYGAVAFSLTAGGQEYGYVGTGYYEEGSVKNYLKDFYKYDPVSNSWSEISSYDGNKRRGASVFILDNNAYMCVGSSSSSSSGLVYDFWVFDPESETWTSRRKTTNADPDDDFDDDYTGIPRYNAVAFTIPVNGVMRGHVTIGSSSYTWEYDQHNDLWTRRTNYYNAANGVARQGGIAFSFYDEATRTGRAFVGLGGSSSSSFYADFREFIPLVEDDEYDDY